MYRASFPLVKKATSEQTGSHMRDAVKKRDKQRCCPWAVGGGPANMHPTPKEASGQDTRATCRGDLVRKGLGIAQRLMTIWVSSFFFPTKQLKPLSWESHGPTNDPGGAKTAREKGSVMAQPRLPEPRSYQHLPGHLPATAASW